MHGGLARTQSEVRIGAKQQKNPNSNALLVAFQRDQLSSAQAGEACKEERQLLAAQTDRHHIISFFLCSKESG